MRRKDQVANERYDEAQFQRPPIDTYGYNARNEYPVQPQVKRKGSRRSNLSESPPYYDQQQYLPQTYEQPQQFHYSQNSAPQPIHDFHEPFVYQQGPEIGRGAYGVVYEGLDVKSGAFMAVKKLKFDDAKVTSSTEVLNEINLMSTLNHENIVRYLGADQKDGHLYIFMEYVPGGSIARLLKKFKRLHESVVRQYTKQILTGLQYLHHNNIVHGDIKAANILVSNDGVVKLSDFGHSRVVQHGNSIADSIRGTPMWMAPEVITDSRHGKPSDIWSLGCTIIEMITGDLPWPEFVKLEPFTIMYRIAQTKSGPEIPEDLSEAGCDFLRKCFEVNCKKRAAVDQLLQHPFVTQQDNWNEAPVSSPQNVIPTPPEVIQRRFSAPEHYSPSTPRMQPSNIQSELCQMTERIEKILQEQNPPRNMRVQSSPVIGAEMSPISYGRSKRRSQPQDSYTSYMSQYSAHQTYMSQQASYVAMQNVIPQQQQQQYVQQMNQRSRYASPDDGGMSTEYMYSPQKGM